jgi:hypothetical protein
VSEQMSRGDFQPRIWIGATTIHKRKQRSFWHLTDLNS